MLVQLEHDGALDIPAGARDFEVSDDFHGADGHGRSRGLPARALSGPSAGGLRDIARRHPQVADPDSGLGRELAGGISLHDAGVSAQGKRGVDALPLRQLGREPAKSQPSGQACARRQPGDRRDGTFMVAGAAARRSKTAAWNCRKRSCDHRLDKYPGDFSAHFNLGALELARGKCGRGRCLPALRLSRHGRSSPWR